LLSKLPDEVFMLRRIVPVLLVVVLIAGTTYYFTRPPKGELTLTGIVTTDSVIVSSQIAGRLQELKVKQGDVVKKGDLLAVIEPDQLRADMAVFEQTEKQASAQIPVAEADVRFQEAQSAAQVAEAQASVSAAAAQVTQAEADVRYQEAQSNAQINEAEASLSAAAAQITQAEADVENARLTFVHTEEAYKQGAEAVQAYDQTRMAYEAQKARLDAVRKQRDAAQSTVNVAKATLEQVAARRAAVEVNQRQVAVAQAAVDVAKANLEQVAARRGALEVNKIQVAIAQAQIVKAKIQLGYTEIRSPGDGIVDVRAALPGEMVNPAQPIVTLINPDDLWVRIDVEESYIDRVVLGDKLAVRLPSGDVLEGTIFYRAVDGDYATQRDVSRTKRDIRTFEVRLRCPNADRRLAVGMTAYVTFPTEAPVATSMAGGGGNSK
jgi:HlyD family secretion protein